MPRSSDYHTPLMRRILSDDDLDDLHGFLAAQRSHWSRVRDEALAILGAGETVHYAASPGDVLRTRSIRDLAVATRHERASVGARWPEDR